MKKGLESCGPGFKASDIHIRWEEGTELKHVTFEHIPRCTDTKWQKVLLGGGDFGDCWRVN